VLRDDILFPSPQQKKKKKKTETGLGGVVQVVEHQLNKALNSKPSMTYKKIKCRHQSSQAQ
jgi:hypothetical protein